MEQREMVCIVCPMGCRLKVTMQDGQVSVSGNTCKRGAVYGEQEMRCPMRVVTSTVRVRGGRHPMCPVKTAQSVPKAEIDRVLEAIRQVRVQAPVKIGDVVLPNIAGTGVNLVASGNVKAE